MGLLFLTFSFLSASDSEATDTFVYMKFIIWRKPYKRIARFPLNAEQSTVPAVIQMLHAVGKQRNLKNAVTVNHNTKSEAFIKVRAYI